MLVVFQCLRNFRLRGEMKSPAHLDSRMKPLRRQLESVSAVMGPSVMEDRELGPRDGSQINAQRIAEATGPAVRAAETGMLDVDMGSSWCSEVANSTSITERRRELGESSGNAWLYIWQVDPCECPSLSATTNKFLMENQALLRAAAKVAGAGPPQEAKVQHILFVVLKAELCWYPLGVAHAVINLRVRDGCPEMTEHQALELYSKIEDKKLACLEKATADTKTKIRETVLALIRKAQNEEVMFLERQGFVVLEIDLERGWYGQSSKDKELVNRHTGLFVKMIYLHALATAGRCVYPPEPSDIKEVPKTFINDGRGAGLEYDMGELEAEVPPEEGAFDFEGEPIEGGAQSSASSSGAVLPQEQVELNDGEDVEDDHEEERSDKRLSPEEDLDLSGPEVVNLIFATALQDNKSAIVLEAIQDVVTYCWALNIPVVRFHCDRGVLHQGYKVSGGGDVVVMSKARTVVGYDELKSRAVDLLADWSQEEAESLIFHVALSLDVGEQKYGVFRHGGVPNYLYPIAVPHKGGELWIELMDGDVVKGKIKAPKAMIASCDGAPRMNKTEVGFTKDIEELLMALKAPLTVVHNVDPAEAAACFSKWVSPVQKELKSFETAAIKVQSSDLQVKEDLKSGRAKIIPMKIVYTIKPPSEEAAAAGEFFRRKAGVVACGNMMADSGEETYAGAAPAEVVRSSLSISSLQGWDAATLDVAAAFLQTPLKEVQCKQRILGQPPRALVRAGLCQEGELWEFIHVVYGLRESPKWWSEFRDHQLA
ncbi:hypothetical protein AK812_SmicGene36730 [Symbiodinium microadriaticum]|uniref:Retrovirus-related Pol polyprotein from transposon TNT 1-94 n=1 Tax=Symbiodinium microadriaticum TaxID=2951 RepID=A0A1Q9CI32_SYMMI|nr:hypothetical protein AK812_SmicGene36730 [Symbiodinium microadriaticum]